MTFTILARDARSGLIGAATASRSLAVGNAVLAVRPGVGAVASQAWTNRSLRGRLLDELAAGAGAAEAVGRVPEWDDRAELRQVAVLPAVGPGAARSGQEITAWAGDVVGDDVVVAGNLLTGAEVLDAMIDGIEWTPSTDVGLPEAAALFAGALVAALAAGELRGGDARGRQSAAVLVGSLANIGDVHVDLRVDDHVDPLAELARLVYLRGLDLADPVSARTA